MEGLILVFKVWECGKCGRGWCALMVQIIQKYGGCSAFQGDSLGVFVGKGGCRTYRFVVNMGEVGESRERMGFVGFYGGLERD